MSELKKLSSIINKLFTNRNRISSDNKICTKLTTSREFRNKEIRKNNKR